MANNLEKYFIKNPNTPPHVEDNDLNKWEKLKANSKKRSKEALEQIKKHPIPISQVFCYVNEFLELLKIENNVKRQTVQIGKIELDNTKHLIVDNGVIVVNCHWENCLYDKDLKKYIYYDNKYNIIQQEFNLSYPSDIIWLKFTVDGYLGVVASSFDINFNYTNTAGRLVDSLEKRWDETFVLVFPLTKDILGRKNKKEIETAVGNYLSEKGVPIIDFYSHNY